MIATRLFQAGLMIAAAAATLPMIRDSIAESAVSRRAAPGVPSRDSAVSAYRAGSALAGGDTASATALARAALARAPLDDEAMRALYLSADRRDDPASIKVLMVAAWLGWRDPVIQASFLRNALLFDDAKDAALRADAMARSDASRPEGFTALDTVLEIPGGARAVAARLATRPPWRAQYFDRLALAQQLDPEATAALLAAMAVTKAPADRDETNSALRQMVRAGGFEAAWRLSRRTAAGRGPIIDDPDFAAAAADLDSGTPASPFAWSAPRDSAVRFAIDRDTAGRPALAVTAPSDRAPAFVMRLLVAEPGRYRLSYRAQGPAASLDRLHAGVRCRGAAIAQTGLMARAAAGDAATFVMPVTIPADCGALELAFSLDGSDTGASTTILLGGVALRRD